MKQLTILWNLIKIFWWEINIKFGYSNPLVLINFLRSPDSETRWNAADALYVYHDQALIAPVFEILQKESDGHVRKRLIWILETNRAWDKLFLCLDSTKRDVRDHAAHALMHSGESRFVLPLLNKMRENDNQDYIYGQILRGIVDKDSVVLLFQYLVNATPAMKSALFELLGVSKNQQVLDRLLIALKDPNAEIREGVVLGLMHLGNLQAIEPLRELLDDPSKNVRGSVNVALRVLENRLG